MSYPAARGWRKWGWARREATPRRVFIEGITYLIPVEDQMDEKPVPTDVYRVGKKAAGSMLDGVEWKQFPGDAA